MSQIAESSLLPFAQATVQIDALRTRSEIAAKLEELASIAKRNGRAIGVANAFPESIAMIAEFARKAQDVGIEITPVFTCSAGRTCPGVDFRLETAGRAKIQAFGD